MFKSKKISTKSAVFVLAVFFTIACSQEQKKQMTPQQVKVVEAVQKDIQDQLDFVGEVYGYQDITIRARVNGFLEGIHFREGFAVKKGQLLYTIDDQPFRAEVAAQQSLLAEAKSIFAKAKSDLSRYKPLAQTNAVSQSDLDGAQVQYEAADAKVKAAEANLELAKIKLGYTRIYSPIDGLIGKTLAKVGEVVGQAPLVVLNTVSKMDQIHVEFFLPESQYLEAARALMASEWNIEDTKNKNPELELVLSDGTIHKHKGLVNFVDRGVDAHTGTILVQATFDNPEKLVRPGQYAKVRVPRIHQDAIIIPQKCVKELQGQYSLFIVNSENKIETRQIVTGAKIGDLWLIKDGLKPGERVVIEGIQKVSNGVPVTATLVEFESQFNSL
ncbi:efflux RND transporter periplasmic adaptor subunit [Prolixibacteraceae bacterium Z1-6]|uniref:Efflux RND transporter periplasmic adaptor subunit n=1 Tax=Draconibacterium aestuarii TaxID=2998507 RepID=A0A9X3J836_9BACT|nr:efflux RND transporter periplasmic adaptor subunit [Prolixibacteraceae bacterium Z1-6]